jgi:2-oxoglutarate ferredoxin oxidoreductase subunit beta
MTGGQMAPTTLIGQRATTAPLGRTAEQAGMPIRMAEMLSTLDGLVYAERVCVTDIPHLNKAKKAIRKAFQKQMAGEGFTFIEVIAACPTNWGMDIVEANQWLMENMAAYYPLGVIKDKEAE